MDFLIASIEESIVKIIADALDDPVKALLLIIILLIVGAVLALYFLSRIINSRGGNKDDFEETLTLIDKFAEPLTRNIEAQSKSADAYNRNAEALHQTAASMSLLVEQIRISNELQKNAEKNGQAFRTSLLARAGELEVEQRRGFDAVQMQFKETQEIIGDHIRPLQKMIEEVQKAISDMPPVIVQSIQTRILPEMIREIEKCIDQNSGSTEPVTVADTDSEPVEALPSS